GGGGGPPRAAREGRIGSWGIDLSKAQGGKKTVVGRGVLARESFQHLDRARSTAVLLQRARPPVLGPLDLVAVGCPFVLSLNLFEHLDACLALAASAVSPEQLEQRLGGKVAVRILVGHPAQKSHPPLWMLIAQVKFGSIEKRVVGEGMGGKLLGQSLIGL